MRLEIIIPTYNHPLYIKKIVETYEDLFEQYDFIVSIHDSSSNNETEMLIKENRFFDKRLKYYRYPATMHVDEKTILALKKCMADFGYLVGDGWIINIAELFAKDYFKSSNDLILLYSENIPLYKNYFETHIKDNKLYTNKSFFAEENFWYLIMYGSSIVKKEFLLSIDLNSVLNKFANKNFIYPCSIMSLNLQTMLVDKLPILIPNLEKKSPMWLAKREGIEIWSKNFYLSMNALRGYIDESSINHIIKTTGKRTTFLSFRGMIVLRYHKNLTFKIFWKYRKYIAKTSNVPLILVLGICCVPRFLFVIAKKIRGKKRKEGERK